MSVGQKVDGLLMPAGLSAIKNDFVKNGSLIYFATNKKTVLFFVLFFLSSYSIKKKPPKRISLQNLRKKKKKRDKSMFSHSANAAHPSPPHRENSHPSALSHCDVSLVRHHTNKAVIL